jgi:DNA-binding NtrC family response regulator
LRRAVALGTKSIIDASDIFEQPDARAEPGQAEPPASMSLSEHLRLTERAHLLVTLQAHDGAIGEAATALGISRKTLWEKMRRYAIDRRASGETPEQSVG